MEPTAAACCGDEGEDVCDEATEVGAGDSDGVGDVDDDVEEEVLELGALADDEDEEGEGKYPEEAEQRLGRDSIIGAGYEFEISCSLAGSTLILL